MQISKTRGRKPLADGKIFSVGMRNLNVAVSVAADAAPAGTYYTVTFSDTELIELVQRALGLVNDPLDSHHYTESLLQGAVFALRDPNFNRR